MTKEVLEITPSGGIYCIVNLPKPAVKTHDFSKPGGYLINELLEQLRLDHNTDGSFLTDGDILRWGISRLCEAPMGRSLAHDARFDDWMIMVEDGDSETRLLIDTDIKCLFLPRYADSITEFTKSQPSQMEFLFQLAKGLRLIWQHGATQQKANNLDAKDFVLLNRMIEADSDLSSILVAYQLREKGDHDFWRYILSAELSKVAVTLCECLDFDPSMDGMLDAMGFVFQDWFADEARLSRIDHDSLSELDEREEEPGTENLQFDDLIQVSMLPDGFSYLEYAAADILSDAYYTRIPDATNEAHLKQIIAETQVAMLEDIGFRDQELARK
ncbi:MAG: hypothetical protein DI586_04905, partial [Micavibrio aeruginosavorus]